MKKFTCYIFARGGSKGVKNKNIADVNGKPLIYYTIKEAKKSRYIKRIVVSTDDLKIINIAKKYNLEIIKRPKKISGDRSPELEAWKHAINVDKSTLDQNDLFISLPTTSPLRTFKDIDRGIKTYLKSRNDLLIAITPSHRNPYLNMVKIKSNKIKLFAEQKKLYRRQDAPKVYDITTAIYVSNRKYILNCKKIIEGKTGFIIIPKERSLDIDDKIDLQIARLFLKK